jgi:hypothetical protein
MSRHSLLAAVLVAAAVVPAAHVAIPAPAPVHVASIVHNVLDRATVVRWVETYLRGWRDKDDVAVGGIFTADAVYQAIPGDGTHTYAGRDAIREYWRAVTANQSDFSARHGEPVIQGDRAVVELWVTVRVDGNWRTFIETNVLYFAPGGQVRRNVEYWIGRDGRFDPPPAWGA